MPFVRAPWSLALVCLSTLMTLMTLAFGQGSTPPVLQVSPFDEDLWSDVKVGAQNFKMRWEDEEGCWAYMALSPLVGAQPDRSLSSTQQSLVEAAYSITGGSSSWLIPRSPIPWRGSQVYAPTARLDTMYASGVSENGEGCRKLMFPVLLNLLPGSRSFEPWSGFQPLWEQFHFGAGLPTTNDFWYPAIHSPDFAGQGLAPLELFQVACEWAAPSTADAKAFLQSSQFAGVAKERLFMVNVQAIALNAINPQPTSNPATTGNISTTPLVSASNPILTYDYIPLGPAGEFRFPQGAYSLLNPLQLYQPQTFIEVGGVRGTAVFRASVGGVIRLFNLTYDSPKKYRMTVAHPWPVNAVGTFTISAPGQTPKSGWFKVMN